MNKSVALHIKKQAAACLVALWSIAAYGVQNNNSSEIPAEFVGAWQAQIEGKGFKLKTNYNIEMKISDGLSGAPEALVSYFAGDVKRPSTICRTQLTLVSREQHSLIFEESRNYRSRKIEEACPIGNQLAIATRGGEIWVQWRDVGRRKVTVKMEAGAHRSTGGMECRTVGGSDRSGHEVWCRTPEGDWRPKAL